MGCATPGVGGWPLPGAARALPRRVAAPLAAATGVVAATLVLAVRDPHVAGSYGFCPVHALTGVYCPLCGGLRAVNDLTAGDVGAALSSNAAVVAALPVAVAVWTVWLLRRWRGRGDELPPMPPAALGWGLCAALLAFGVLRNLPVAAALAP